MNLENKPRLLFDTLIFYLQDKGGGSRIWSELLSNFSIDLNIDLLSYSYKNKNLYFNQEVNLSSRIKYQSKLSLKLARYLPFNPTKQENNVVFHSSYFRTINNEKVPKNRCFTTIHDLTTDYYDNFFRKRITKYQRDRSLKNSGSVVCISNSTKNNLLKIYPSLDSNKDIRVIPHGISDCFHNSNKKLNNINNLEKCDYLLYVGSRYEYKNFEYFIQITNELDNYVNKALIIGGGPLSEKEKKLISNVDKVKFEHKLQVKDNELVDIYKNALCLIYPSSAEGFGLPVLEAAACGCPVICQKLDAIFENASDFPIYVDLDNIQKTSLRIKDICNLQNKQYYIDYGKEISKGFTWEKASSLLEEFYLDKII